MSIPLLTNVLHSCLILAIDFSLSIKLYEEKYVQFCDSFNSHSNGSFGGIVLLFLFLFSSSTLELYPFFGSAKILEYLSLTHSFVLK